LNISTKIFVYSPKAIGGSRLSSGKPGKNKKESNPLTKPKIPVNPVQKVLLLRLESIP
jgi:hypothetical protein